MSALRCAYTADTRVLYSVKRSITGVGRRTPHALRTPDKRGTPGERATYFTTVAGAACTASAGVLCKTTGVSRMFLEAEQNPQSHDEVTDREAAVTHGRTAVKNPCSSSRACHLTRLDPTTGHGPSRANEVSLHCIKPPHFDTSHCLCSSADSTQIDPPATFGHEQQHSMNHVVVSRAPGIDLDNSTENPLNIGVRCRRGVPYTSWVSFRESVPAMGRTSYPGPRDLRHAAGGPSRSKRSRRTDRGAADLDPPRAASR